MKVVPSMLLLFHGAAAVPRSSMEKELMEDMLKRGQFKGVEGTAA